MYNVQGRRPEIEEVCLLALLENSEGQAQVDGKAEGNWSCKKTSNKKQKTVTNSSLASVAAAVAPTAPLAGGADVDPSSRPDGKKKEKQKLRQHSTIEAVVYLMAKKKEADLERDLKKKRGATKPLLLVP